MDDKAVDLDLRSRIIEKARQIYRRGLKLWYKTAGRVVDWPPTPGHFILGNLESAVAVCTLSSTALIDQISPEYSAIIGRIYTPNLGVEKMIRNVVSNPRLRYLVLCGKDSPVFKVGEALLRLKTNGLDEKGHIIGAAGSLAELTNLPRQTVETFRQQVELVDYIGELNPKRLNQAAKELFERRTPPYQSPTATELSPEAHLKGETPLELQAQRRTWLELDPLGYFVVNLDREKGEIVLERYTTGMKLTHIIRGRAADVVYLTAIREKLLSQYEHAAYLGAELAKAETALYNKLPYEQDKKLKFRKAPQTPAGNS
jgi:tetrahydromethanopterin S-methyltransferase subunit A